VIPESAEGIATARRAAADLATRLHAGERGRLREALRGHPLAVLDAPGLTPAGLLEVAASLGEVVPSTLKAHALPGFPSLLVIGNSKDPVEMGVGGSAVSRGWHTDMSYDEHPPELTLLYGVTVPRSGSETHFSSLEALWERLPPDERAALAPLRVEHEYRSPRAGEPVRRAVHPLVRAHPDSGRPLVHASPGYAARILGLEEEASRALLARLAAALDPPDHVHRWRAGDLLVWDNRALAHRATPHDPRELRVCWRAAVRLRGDEARS
jgi:taurine dioxygenase